MPKHALSSAYEALPEDERLEIDVGAFGLPLDRILTVVRRYRQFALYGLMIPGAALTIWQSSDASQQQTKPVDEVDITYPNVGVSDEILDIAIGGAGFYGFANVIEMAVDGRLKRRHHYVEAGRRAMQLYRAADLPDMTTDVIPVPIPLEPNSLLYAHSNLLT